MTPTDLAGLAALIFAAALLYSMVGHAGASGYLAALALYGLAPAAMKPTALVLNLMVATIATVQFARAGRFAWARFWPFALTSIPFAFVGGSLTLPDAIYRQVVGAVLLYAAVRLFFVAGVTAPGAVVKPVPRLLALPLGAGIGLLSGLVGVGGGIFLSPLLLLAGWADAPTTAGVSAAFILVNSLSGLLGHVASVRLLPPGMAWLGVAAVAGGLIGSTLGSRRLAPAVLRRMLAVVLVVAAAKLILVRG
ncbi:MAG: sulfite exporter TauE/SafE family protein [Candidatus Eisenbacteria bacterium]